MGAPLHPLVVHFPIVLLIAAVIAGFVGSLPRLHWLRIVELVLLGAGLVSAVIARQLGEQNADTFSATIQKSRDAANVLQLHDSFSKWVVIVFGLLLLLRLATWAWEVWRNWQEMPSWQSKRMEFLMAVFGQAQVVPLLVVAVYLLGSLVGLVMLTLTGYYGGELVFTYGVGLKS